MYPSIPKCLIWSLPYSHEKFEHFGKFNEEYFDYFNEIWGILPKTKNGAVVNMRKGKAIMVLFLKHAHFGGHSYIKEEECPCSSYISI